MIRRICDKWVTVVRTGFLSLGNGQGFCTFYLVYFSVWLVIYTRTHVYDKNIQLLDKQKKALCPHCAFPFQNSSPSHYTSFNPCRPMRPTKQVELPHSAVAERGRDLPKITDRDRALCFQLQCKAWKAVISREPQKSHDSSVLYGFQMSPRAGS